MMQNIASEIWDIQQNLEAERQTFESHWEEIAQYVLPRQDDFQDKRTPGEKRTRYITDSTAPLALERFAAAMESILTPRSNRWHTLTATEDELNENQEVSEWFDKVTDLLFWLRYSPRANYASQQHEVYMSLGAFGTGVLIVEDVVGEGIRYKSSHISEHFFTENLHGTIDTDYRKFKLTARQAEQRFGSENMTAAMQRALIKNPNEKFTFIHCVRPNNGEAPAEFPFISVYASEDGKKLMGKPGGFKTFPYITSRYVTSPTEVYGRSPAMTALAEIKMLNAIRKSDLRARHMAIDPPILAANEQTIRKVQMQPGAINYGAVDMAGRPLIQPWQNGARVDISNDSIQQSREMINDTFLVTLFQILVESPAMTATEVLQRAQEKGALLAPTMGRQQSEALGPMITREMSILESYGLFDVGAPYEMPEALRERDGDYQIEYSSPLNRMMRTEDGLATQRTVEAALPLAQIDPGILDNFDWDEYVEIMREANGAPAKLFRSDEEKEQIRQGREQQQQMQQMVAAAPQVAGSIKDIAQAQSYAG